MQEECVEVASARDLRRCRELRRRSKLNKETVHQWVSYNNEFLQRTIIFKVCRYNCVT